MEASRWAGVRKTRAWQDLVHPIESEVAFTPTIAAGEALSASLKRTQTFADHPAMLMASG